MMPSAHGSPAAGGRVTLRDGREVAIRAIQTGDADEVLQAFGRMSSEARYMRFMQHKRELHPMLLERILNPAAGRECVLVATIPADDGIDIVGLARYVVTEAPATCEFAVTIADDWQGTGLATTLMRSLVDQAPRDGYAVVEGFVLKENHAMLALARKLGFDIRPDPEDSSMQRVALSVGP